MSLFTWTGIIGVMLAGTALGNFTGGLARRPREPARRDAQPAAVLAATLIVAAAGATVLIAHRPVLQQRRGVRRLRADRAGRSAWTFSLFFLPMFLLGMVSPQVIRLAVPDVAHVGRVAGRVYAWSTAGAIVGTFAAGYVLLSALGMTRRSWPWRCVLTLTQPARCAGSWRATNVLLYLFSIVLGGVTGGFILTARSGDATRT